MAQFGVGIRITTSGTGAARGLAGVARQARQVAQSSQRAGRGINLLAGGMANLGRTMGAIPQAASRSFQGMRTLIGQVFSLRNAVLAAMTTVAGGALFDKLIGSNAAIESRNIGMASTIQANLEFRDSLGRVLDAQGQLDASLAVGTKVFERFRSSAIDNVGTSTEMIELFNASLNAGLSGGKSIEQIAGLAEDATTLMHVIGNDLAQASNDINFILSGQAGAENRTWRALRAQVGLTAEAFNALPASERFDRLAAAIRRFATPEVQQKYARSWEGLTSSLQEYITRTATAFGGPLFEFFKSQLGTVIDYLTANRASIEATAKALGEGLVGGIKAVVSFGRQAIGFYRNNKAVIDTLATGIVALTVGFYALRAAQILLAATPIGLLFTAAAFALGLLIRNWDTIVAGFKGFVSTLGPKLAKAWAMVKIGFNAMGLFLVRKAQENPVLNWLFGGKLKAAEIKLKANIEGLRNEVALQDQIIARAELEAQAANPSDARAQYSASRLLARQGETTVSVTQTIVTSDPQAAADKANQGIRRAVQAGQNPGRLGQPLTSQPR
jgi:hypothetical protein